MNFTYTMFGAPLYYDKVGPKVKGTLYCIANPNFALKRDTFTNLENHSNTKPQLKVRKITPLDAVF